MEDTDAFCIEAAAEVCGYLEIGRHRCIGESFAFLQIKTVVAMFLREFKHDLVRDATGRKVFPKMDYTSLIVMPEKNSYISLERRTALNHT